jgi:hypothetical protein
MKKIILIVGALLLVGCASKPDSKYFDGWIVSNKQIATYSCHTCGAMRSYYGYKPNFENYTLKLKTDGVIRSYNKNISLPFLNSLCADVFGTQIESYPKPQDVSSTYPFIKHVFEWKKEINVTCLSRNEYIAEQEMNILLKMKTEKDAEERLEAREALILEGKKSKCREYGFKDDTDGMGLCLIELDKLEAIEKQQINQQLAQNAAIKKQQADAKRQRESQALINLGALISGTGTKNNTNRAAPRINTYPDNFSTTLTVSSNQNCPLKGTPLTKQEVRGSNRICYYQ